VMVAERSHVVSSFTLIKGALINETYAVLAAWDFRISKKENLDRLRHTNYIGASSETWLRDVAKVINRRFVPDGPDQPLALLAKGGCSLDEWKPLLLWHMTRDEFLLRDFLQNWLFPAFEAGAFRVRPEHLYEHLGAIGTRGGATEHEWTEPTSARVAAGLLKIAGDFGLLRGGNVKEFASYHLPERSFLYLLHALRDSGTSPSRIATVPDWRMFLMRPVDVEHELLRLHQFRKLTYEVAGSLVGLTLPNASSLAYAESMVA
jgi:hypothetical protein